MRSGFASPPRLISPIMDGLIRSRAWTAELQKWAGVAISMSILVVVAIHLGRGGLAALVDAPTRQPAFWVFFLLLYAAPSIAEWTIFRRLWRLPVVGLAPLLRKQIANELVLGYSGDAHFYLWARSSLRMPNSPFGAVKDVAILSAVAGNAVTLALMVLSGPVLAEALSGPLSRAFLWSAGAIALSSLVLFALRRTLFSLSKKELVFVLAVHVARVGTCLTLLAVVTHILIPDMSVRWLGVIVTLRMMLSRLPLVPAKDAVFAGLVAVLFGGEARIASAIALIASLTLAMHLVVGLGTPLTAVVNRKEAA